MQKQATFSQVSGKEGAGGEREGESSLIPRLISSSARGRKSLGTRLGGEEGRGERREGEKGGGGGGRGERREGERKGRRVRWQSCVFITAFLTNSPTYFITQPNYA